MECMLSVIAAFHRTCGTPRTGCRTSAAQIARPVDALLAIALGRHGVGAQQGLHRAVWPPLLPASAVDVVEPVSGVGSGVLVGQVTAAGGDENGLVIKGFEAEQGIQ